MSKLQITIKGEQGTGKTTVANLLKFHMEKHPLFANKRIVLLHEGARDESEKGADVVIKTVNKR